MRALAVTLAFAVATLALPGASRTAHAQAKPWPERPVRIFVPSAAGGAADFAARLTGDYLKNHVQGAVAVVENRPGAGGIVGTEAARNAPADGYSFLLSTNSTHAANVSLYRKLPYDPEKDFVPVGMLGSFATIAIVPQASPFKSVPELVKHAKANPGKVSFGYYSSSSRVPPELLKAQTGIDIVGVPYKNITQIITDIAGGQIELAFLDSLSASPALQNPRISVVAVSARERLRQLPNAPTVAETLPGFEVEGWLGLTAPTGTPREVVARMNALLAQAVADPAFRSALERQGMTPRAMTPEAMGAFISADRARWADWIRKARIEPE
jgi:tripartite-type tricarboxylate transporter receptor subunit TctC